MKPDVKQKIQVADSATIKSLLSMRGITQTEVARRLKAHRSWVGDVINGRKKTEWIQNGIARILGVKRSKIFFVAARPYRTDNGNEHVRGN